MSEKTSGPVPVRVLSDQHSVPLIYFDGAPGVSFNEGGIYSLLLVATRTFIDSNGTVGNGAAPAAQLNCHRNALIALRNAIDGALLLGQKAEGQTN
ncbi:MAG: hypothetical protein KF742_06495 [Cryobacterium sp.]|nr:hypothetical protein [Cryobacterium sp.]